MDNSSPGHQVRVLQKSFINTSWITLSFSSWLIFWTRCTNPLYYAVLCGFHALVEHLIIGHPHLINTVSGSFDFPVLTALSRKHIQVTEILLWCGGKVDIWGRLGRTVLQQSITPGLILREDVVDVVSFLLKNRADVKFRGSDLSTPLHTAAYHLTSEVVQLLLESGADINSRDDEGRIPLHVVNIYADRRESQARDVAQLLLKWGTNVHAQDNDGAMSLLEAAYRNYVDISQNLLEHGAEPNVKNNDCETSLHRCLGNDEQGPTQYSLVRLLLGHGVVMVRFGSVRFRGYFARTPNQTIGSVQQFPRTLNWTLGSGSKGSGSGLGRAERWTEHRTLFLVVPYYVIIKSVQNFCVWNHKRRTLVVECRNAGLL